MPRTRRIVVAFGGNALIREGQQGTQWEQLDNAENTARMLLPLVQSGCRLVIVHGNGPQVGNILIQVEEAVTKIPPQSLDVCVAASEGSIGYMLQTAIRNALRRGRVRGSVVTLITEVVVDPSDAGFRRPTKPIGPFYTRYRADYLIHKLGWAMIEDSGRGWRKVVPSPRPLEIHGLDAVDSLLASGYLVIAGGGGGIPVVTEGEGGERGVEAVIDKDYTAGLMAAELGADLLAILTDVDRVFLDFGTEQERGLSRLSVEEARRHLAEGQFPPGSMGPKVETAAEFVETTGGEALITSTEQLGAALRGRGGTWVNPGGSTSRRTRLTGRRKKR